MQGRENIRSFTVSTAKNRRNLVFYASQISSSVPIRRNITLCTSFDFPKGRDQILSQMSNETIRTQFLSLNQNSILVCSNIDKIFGKSNFKSRPFSAHKTFLAFKRKLDLPKVLGKTKVNSSFFVIKYGQ